MKKKILSVLLCAVLILGALPLSALAAELPFTDVPEKAWYKDAVSYVYENELFKGNSATEFAPNKPMTRGMFVKVLSNKTANYVEADWENRTRFTDVKASAWYAGPIEWASKAGLVKGTGNGKFTPNGNVTREQMAVILYNYAAATGNDTSLDLNALTGFSDAASVSGFAKEAMQWAVTHEIIKGDSNGLLAPRKSAKRCEVATVFVNADPILIKTEVEATPDEPQPSDKFATVEELVKADEFQSELKALKESMAANGLNIDIQGKGNDLIFVFAFQQELDENKELLAQALKEALDKQAAVFEDLAASLQEAVEAENPAVVVTYTDRAGGVIHTQRFTAK